MNKLLLGALPLVAGASWAGTTLYSGSQSEDAYAQLVQQLDQMSGYSVKQEAWEPGFLESQAITRVSASDAADAPVLVRLKHNIYHSPVNLDGQGELVNASRIVTTLLSDDLSESGQKLFGLFDDEPITLTTHIGFGGSSQNVAQIAAMKVDAEELKFDMAASEVNFTFDPEGKLQGTGTVGAASLLETVEGLTMAMEPGEADFDLDWAADGIYTGTQSVRLGKLTLNEGKPGSETILTDASLVSTADVNDERLTNDLIMESKIANSFIPVDEFRFSTKIENLAMNGFSEVMKISATLNDQAFTDEPEAALEHVAEAYKQLIVPGSGLHYGLELGNSEGDAKAFAKVVFEGSDAANATDASAFDSMATVGDLVGALSAQADLDADLSAVAMTPIPVLLGSPGISDWLVNDGETISSKITLEDLVLNVNGNPIPLEMMLGEMLQMPLDMTLLGQ